MPRPHTIHSLINKFPLSLSLSLAGLPEFPLGLPLPPHALPGHPAALSAEFWPPHFALHQHFNPALLPQQLMPPHYKLPNFHTLLSQYMGLSNLNGIFGAGAAAAAAAAASAGYPQNLSLHPASSAQVSPPCSNSSPRESPNSLHASAAAAAHALHATTTTTPHAGTAMLGADLTSLTSTAAQSPRSATGGSSNASTPVSVVTKSED